MPATSVTCPFCKATLTSKTPIPGGTRIKCPKCSTLFVVKADDAEEVPPTVPAPPKMAPRSTAPKPAAGPPPPPKPTAPKPPAAAAPKPAVLKPAAVTAKPKPPPAEEEIVEIDEEEIVEITDDIDEEEPLEVIDDEAPVKTRRKRAAKGSLFQRFPMWVWLTGGGVALLVVLGGCTGVALLAWSLLGGPSITKDNYEKIKMGSAEKDVTAIMGQPNSSMEDIARMAGVSAPPATIPGGGKILVWKRGDDFLEVGLLQDKVFYKACKVGADFSQQLGF